MTNKNILMRQKKITALPADFSNAHLPTHGAWEDAVMDILHALWQREQPCRQVWGAEKVITLASGHEATTIRFQNNTESTDGVNEKFNADFYKDDSTTGFKWGADGDKLMVSEVVTTVTSGNLTANGTVAAGLDATGKAAIIVTDAEDFKGITFGTDVSGANSIKITAGQKLFFVMDGTDTGANDTANMYFVLDANNDGKIATDEIHLVGTVNAVAEATVTDANFA